MTEGMIRVIVEIKLLKLKKNRKVHQRREERTGKMIGLRALRQTVVMGPAVIGEVLNRHLNVVTIGV